MPRQPWREVDDELRFHLDMRIRDYLARGLTQAEAERAAGERFGDVEHVRRVLESHDARRERMSRLWQDIRLALRGFRRSPTFTITAVAILGVGIGMSVAMWTVFSAVMVRRFPVRDQDRIVLPRTLDPSGVDLGIGAVRELREVRHQMRTMSDIAGVVHWGAYDFPLSDGDRPIVVQQAMVTGNFFEILGARPAVGRLLRSDDDTTSRAMVLSYATWQRQFRGDPEIVGHRVRQEASGLYFTIVGVAEPGLDYPAGAEAWFPVWGNVDVDAIARLAPGASPAAARSEYFAIVQRLNRERAVTVNVTGSDVSTFRTAVVGNVRPAVIAIASAVGLLLLIVCSNVGNLLLLRAAGRSRELAVRRALGASYGDVVRQLLVESSLLALTGGGLGLAVAEGARRALVAAAPARLPRLDVLSVSGTPAAAAAVVALVTVILFGLLPALTAVRRNPASPLRLDARSGAATRQRRRTRQLLVASQVALALVMLAGAGLLARTLRRLETIPLGYTADHLGLLEITFPAKYQDSLPNAFRLADALATRIAAVPGVKSVTPLLIPPFQGPNVWTGAWEVEGQSNAQIESNPLVPEEVGGPAYFRTLGIPVLRGRGFVDADREDAPRVVVVSEGAARLFWPGQDPIGKRLRFWKADSTTWRTVVGVAGDIHYRSMRALTPTVYLPYRQSFWQGFMAYRSTVDPISVLPSIRHVVSAFDPTVDVWRGRAMDELLAEPLAQPRMNALLLSGFGLVALVLAALGLYGIMATAVREQTRDIGVRMALGASPGQVRGEVLRRAMLVSLSGAAVGIAIALATSRVLASLLFDVSPTDPIALLGACGALLGVALIAAYLPASHASRIDPARALQTE